MIARRTLLPQGLLRRVSSGEGSGAMDAVHHHRSMSSAHETYAATGVRSISTVWPRTEPESEHARTLHATRDRAVSDKQAAVAQSRSAGGGQHVREVDDLAPVQLQQLRARTDERVR